MAQLFADIALPVPIPQTFTYSVPEALQSACVPGMRALVSFGNKYLTGVVLAVTDHSEVKRIKPIVDLLDAAPAFLPDLLELSRWISDYYLAPIGEVVRAASPHGAIRESKRIVRLRTDRVQQEIDELRTSASAMRAVLSALAVRPVQTVAQLQERIKLTRIHSVLGELARKQLIDIEEELQRPNASVKKATFIAMNATLDVSSVNLTPKQRAAVDELNREGDQHIHLQAFLKRTGATSSVLATLIRKGIVLSTEREVIRSGTEEIIEPPIPLVLNVHQSAALAEVTAALDADTYATFLLHGVTGSGKTQVYIEAIRHTLAKGKTAIILVPEISLTPQTVRRFKAHFGDDVTVMHSQMSAGERYDAWRLARAGRVRIVIGPRSAVFAPLERVGLIVVDEEHEGSYKQYDATPRYNARDVAVVRASLSGAVVMLGSATPSTESYYNAVSGKYRLLELPVRADNAKLPVIVIVNMGEERRRQYAAIKAEVKEKQTPFPKRLPDRSVSKLLEEHIRERIKKGEGTILLQNRRGFSHVVECFDCGYVERCDACDVSLTYHATKKHLRCHYCGAVKRVPQTCPTCAGTEIRFYAFGTQQVEQELAALFPEARIVRMDRDATTRRGAHEKILRQFEAGGADILLGTQMVAKGLDFPRVTLVGVISADTQMMLPDFRASETTFQLLTQVAGRAGRSTLAGEVVIQSMQTDHYALKHASTHDFKSFYEQELGYRRELDYPPFSRLVLIECSGAAEGDVEKAASLAASVLREHDPRKILSILGPAEAAIPRLRGRFRMHVVIKDPKSTDPSGRHLKNALQALRNVFAAREHGFLRNTTTSIDVDPYGMM